MLDLFDKALWPRSELPSLIEFLALRAGFHPRAAVLARVPEDPGLLPAWFESACAGLGLEAEPVTVWAHEFEAKLKRAVPAVLPVEESGFLAVERFSRGQFVLLTPDLTRTHISLAALRTVLCRRAEEPYREGVEILLDECEITGRERGRTASTLLRERIRDDKIATLWELRTPPGESLWLQMRQAKLTTQLWTFVLSHGTEYVLSLAGWWLIGRAALSGRIDAGWLLAWALTLLTVIPFRLLTIWSQGILSVGCAGLLRQRLLVGALRFPADLARREGIGHLLSRVVESEAVETLALSGGLLGGLSVVELVIAVFILAKGAGGILHAMLLAGWMAVALNLAWRLARRWLRWTDVRLALTHDIVERMTGHRTRLAQEPAAERHISEDQALERYLAVSRNMDQANATLTAVVQRGWMVVGVAGLAPAFVSGNHTATQLAVSLGGVLLAGRALKRFTQGIANLIGAYISWRQVTPLFRSAADSERPPTALPPTVETAKVLESQDLSFRFADRDESVICGANLQVQRGERILLEGESGGGKSTLVSLLTGLRQPSTGLILAGGFDPQTLGSTNWRKRVAAAPQYHENHVLIGTFLFNVLMGRTWPPQRADVVEAEEVCRELGLGTLIDRMPGGMLQMVGETGWQLSQGERSRIYVARALLQGSDLVILDESFAALDPETLRDSLTCVLQRAKTLMVVAHP